MKAVAYVFLRLLHCRTVVCFTMSRAMSISRPRHETALQEPWKRPCEAFLASGAHARAPAPVKLLVDSADSRDALRKRKADEKERAERAQAVTVAL